MNANQLFNMLTRMVGNRLLKWSMAKTGRKAGPEAVKRPTQPQRNRDKLAREATKRARQAARITRRMK